MSYLVEYELEAIDDLSKLSSSIQKRIVNKIEWLSENCEKIKHQSLKNSY
jgi:mRNA interferase RelE/StbE